MRIKIRIIILFLLSSPVYCQQAEYDFNLCTIEMNGNAMTVKSGESLLYSRTFYHPEGYTVDLDSDSLDEFVVIDPAGDSSSYTIYIYNTLDSVYLADSINSGFYQPYFTYSDEIGDMIIITGDPNYMQFRGRANNFLPINCYKFESGEVFSINDEVYEAFMSENDIITDSIDAYFEKNDKDCESSKEIISAISAAYVNYMNAGETILAHQLLEEFYFCGDKDALRKKFDDTIQKQ